MSSLNNPAMNATEKGVYVEHMKQATDATQNNASTYVDQAKEAASGVVTSAQKSASQATSQTKNAIDDFQSHASSQTNASVNEGEKDVEAMKHTGAGYVDQAKTLIGNAISTTQGGVSGSNGISDPDAPQSGVLQATANTTFETSKTYLASAQEAIQPHLQSAQETVQPYLDSAQATVKQHMDTAINAAEPYAEKARSTFTSAFGSSDGGKNQSA